MDGLCRTGQAILAHHAGPLFRRWHVGRICEADWLERSRAVLCAALQHHAAPASPGDRVGQRRADNEAYALGTDCYFAAVAFFAPAITASKAGLGWSLASNNSGRPPARHETPSLTPQKV